MIKNIGVLLITCICICSCLKPKEGFLSKNIYYRANPFNATQGGVTVSAPLETDGSTTPLTVKLLSVRNKSTGKPADELLQEKEIQVYLKEITADDNTVEKINAKLGKKMVKPFNVNPVGGRLEVSQASEFVDTGTYVIDIEVSNVAGTRVINNAATIRILPKKHFEFFGTPSFTNSDPPPLPDGNFLPSTGSVTITRTAGPNKIILKFVDKNGMPYNPKTGQVIIRGDRPHFAQMNPYFAEEKTDTALVFQYPVTPFPLIRGSFNNFINYYRIPHTANSLARNINATFEFRVYSTGTYLVTIQTADATKL
jgi:hypothetical protein